MLVKNICWRKTCMLVQNFHQHHYSRFRNFSINVRESKSVWTCSQVKGEMITDGRFIFSSVLLVFVRFFRLRIKFSLIPALKHAVSRHFWHRCRSVPDVKSHEFWPNRQMYSTLLSTDLLKKPLSCSFKYNAMEITIFGFKWRTKTFTALTGLNRIMKTIWWAQANCADCILSFDFLKFTRSPSNDSAKNLYRNF